MSNHLRHHTPKDPVEREEAAPLAAGGRHLVDDEDDEAAGGAAEHGGEDGGGDGVGVAVLGYGQLRAAVEGDEAEEEDEATEGGERHRVARHLQGTAVLVEPEMIKFSRRN